MLDKITTIQVGNVSQSTEGMTLRDYFAGQALTGIVSSCFALDDSRCYEAMANDAYYFADAMMEAQKKFGEVPEVQS